MRLQGAISPRVEARLDEMLGHPETCPHGNPIDAETARRRPAGIRLSEMEAGSPATIYRITEEAEEDAGLLSYLEARALTPGRARHDPGPQRIARLADARRAARPGDARPPAGGARPRPARRGRPGALPPRPGTGPAGRDDARPARPDRPEPDRPAPHRDGPDGAVQLPVRPPHRRHVHPAARGHRPGPQLDRLREGHPRRPALAGPRTGTRAPRSPARRPAARSPRTARCSGCRSTPRPPSASSPPTRPTPATARPRSSTPTGRRRRRPSSRRATSAAAPHLTPEERAAREAEGRRGALRFRVGEGVVAFDDIVRGRVEFDVANLGGDFVIVRGDGTPLYHFTVVVDDAAMEISHVIRGEDHLSNTPKHILLFRALGHAGAAVRPPAAHPQRRPDEDEQAQEPDRGRRTTSPRASSARRSSTTSRCSAGRPAPRRRSSRSTRSSSASS